MFASAVLTAPGAAAATVGGETINRANQQQIIEVFNGINAFRATKGLKPVTFNATVSEMAEDWSDNMASTGEFRHNPDYLVDSRVKDRWAAAGEIIAARSDASGQGLVNQWINSPPHNAIMSDPNYATIGVGIARIQNAAPGKLSLYGTVNFFKFWTPPAGTYTTAQDFFDVTPSPDPALVFADVPSGSQFAAEIGWLASKKISTGWIDGNGTSTYRPSAPVNRDAMAAFMYRLDGSPPFVAPAVSPFADVTPTTQFYKEITWLASKKISTGWAEGGGLPTYRPWQPVNRDAMAAFMYRFAGSPNYTAPSAALAAFTDVPAERQFYKEISWLSNNQISTGWASSGSAEYRPDLAVNRDAMAAFMYRWNAKFGAL